MLGLELAPMWFGLGLSLLFAGLLFKVRFQLFEKLIVVFIPHFWSAAYLLKLLFKASWE
jgi:hypothetical protein